MDSEQGAAIAAARSEIDRALGISEAPSRAAGLGVHEPFPQREAPGELQQLGSGPLTEEALREVARRLEVRSPIAAEAVNLALTDIREFELEGRGLEAFRFIAGCYVYDLVLGVIELGSR